MTRAVTLTDGRWRVTVEVENNIDSTFGTDIESNVIVDALGEGDYLEELVNDIAGSGRWTGTLAVVDGIFEIESGKVWFEVEGVVQTASWTITINPL